MKNKILVITIFTVWITAFAFVQFDINGDYVFTEKEPGESSLSSRSRKINSYLHAEREFSPGNFFYLTQELIPNLNPFSNEKDICENYSIKKTRILIKLT